MKPFSRRVIARRNLPARPPWEFTAIAVMLLLVFETPMLYWLVAGVLLAILWIMFLVRISGETEVDLLDGNTNEKD